MNCCTRGRRFGSCKLSSAWLVDDKNATASRNKTAMFKVARLPFVFFAIIGSVQCSLGERVRAQDIDPNILSRVESFVPEPAPAVIPKRREVIEEKRLIPGREVTRTVPIPIEELDEQ